MYVDVTNGFTETDVPVVALNPVDGLQVYVVAPVAVSVELLPLQIETGGTLIIGCEFTVTITEVVFVQPFAFVPFTVYVVVAIGLTVTVLPVVALIPELGLHV